MKLLGFLLGALLGIGLIAGGLWWLVRPGAEPGAAAAASAPARDQGPIAPLTAAELAVPSRQPAADAAGGEPAVPSAGSGTAANPAAAAERTTTAPAADEPGGTGQMVARSAADEPADEQPATPLAPPSPAPAPPARTYTLWRPFSSRSAAQGFARQIREQSDVTAEVRRQGDAAFEVVLPYRDEQELADMVRAIEDATRLEIR